MQRACFLHQGSSSGSSMTKSLYLLPGCICSPRVSPRSHVLRSRSPWPGSLHTGGQDGTEVPTEPRFHPLPSTGCFPSDGGPQLNALVSQPLGSSVQTTQPTEREIFGGPGCDIRQFLPGQLCRARGRSTFPRAGMQDTPHSEGTAPAHHAHLMLRSGSKRPGAGTADAGFPRGVVGRSGQLRAVV